MLCTCIRFVVAFFKYSLLKNKFFRRSPPRDQFFVPPWICPWMDLVETPINLCRATSSLSLPMLLRLAMVSHTKNALVHPFIHLNKYITNSLKLLKHFNGLYKHFKKLGYAQVRLCPPHFWTDQVF